MCMEGLSPSRFTKKKFERESKEAHQVDSSSTALLAGLRQVSRVVAGQLGQRLISLRLEI